MRRPPVIVVDTNVFIAARFNPRSSSAKIIDLCIEGKCVPLISWRLWRETEAILKRVNAEAEFGEKFSRFLKKAQTVDVRYELPLVMEDPDDNKFLNCALFGKADYLVTSDEHLLKLDEYLGVKIRQPSHFLNSIGLKAGEGERRGRRRYKRNRSRKFRQG